MHVTAFIFCMYCTHTGFACYDHTHVQCTVRCTCTCEYCKTRINNVPLILTILTFAINSLKF